MSYSSTNANVQHPMILVILDGWGHRTETKHNAIAQARTPHWDKLWAQHPHTLLSGSGEDVGLPEGQMGNSEIGHMNIGAGRPVHQGLSLINQAIKTGAFEQNSALLKTIEHTKKQNKALHLMGLVSDGGVHSHESHLFSLINLAQKHGLSKIYVHAFLDGRDTAPKSAGPSLKRLEQQLKQTGGALASIIGRFYAMDRDQRWERIEPAYRLLTEAQGNYQTDNSEKALSQAYQRGETDEFVQATHIQHPEYDARLQDEDCLIFFNFRADRARQITSALIEPEFTEFKRTLKPKLSHFVSFAKYAEHLDTEVAFPTQKLNQSLGEVLSEHGFKQLRIAETEKYAHVTFFLNGGTEQIFPGEERILIPSPTDVRTYDEKPQMSAKEITAKLVEVISQRTFDVIICNFANGDMVGHTGNFEAAVAAVETIDECLGHITAAVKSVHGQCLITADHGNVENMVDLETGQANTAHTCEPVPLVYFGQRDLEFSNAGILADVAPTLLALMDLQQPNAMSGQSLVKILDKDGR